MSDIENSAVDEESVSVSKKNGVGSTTENGNNIAALKEKAANTVTTAAAAAVTAAAPAVNEAEEKMEVEEESEKLNGSSSPKKSSGNDHPVMNGGSEGEDDVENDNDDDDDESKDEHTTTNGDSVVNGGSHRSDGNASQTVTDDDSVQMATPEPSRRGSPRKAAMSGQIQEFSSSDEYDDDEEVEEIKDDDDDSSDSIMELEAEDPLAGPHPLPSQTEKTKSGPNIVTIDDVKALQLLAASSAKKQQESDKVVLIDTNTILAGKATSGVTITPAKPRVLPLGSGTIGSGVTISHASSKPMSRGVGLPIGTTMTSLGSGGSNSALPASQNSGFTYDKQGQLNDPNLTDDTFVVEAPSFIVPYVYEKPPKETFTEFKSSIETLVKDLKKKADATNDDEKEDDKSSEPTTVSEVKKPSGATFFDSHLGNFVINLGMNLVQEHVQTDLLREQTRKSQKDKSASVMHAIMSLKKNLEASKDKNDGFHFDLRKCRYCSFRTESLLVLESHYETPHMKNGMLRCNYCHFETKAPQEILAHMQTKHGVRGKLERAIAAHQCPQCPFEDGMRGKLTRHKVGCDKRFRGDRNQEPPHDWEPPAKIPKPSPFSRGGRPNMMAGAGSNANYHSMTGGIGLGGLTASHHSAVRMGAGGGFPSQRGAGYPGMPSLQFSARGRGRPVGTYKPGQPGFPQGFRQVSPGVGSMGAGRQVVGGSVLNNQVVLQTVNSSGSRYGHGSSATSPAAAALLNNLGANSSVTIQSISQRNNNPRTGQPSISITPLPGRGGAAGHSSARPQSSAQQPQQALKPGQPTGQGKSGFVICEICDGYIKDLEQLRNHMQWIHKVKIHPKMIYNRPPLNCQKCQFRFFTDQGLERHLLGSHGLVTASMQDLANKGQDSGRCPVCGKVYQWKLLNHVSKDHSKTLKPAHLSYKCTVCTATFGQYKLFENHVYTAHSGGNKKAGEKGGRATPQRQPSSSAASKIASLKMSDEITIIPQGKAASLSLLAASKTTLTPTTSKKVSEIDSAKKKLGGAASATGTTTKTATTTSSPKKKDVSAESDQDIIELDDEEEADDDEEIDDVEETTEQQQRSPAKRVGKSLEASSGEGPSEAKKAKASATTSEDDGADSEEEGVEEINDDDE